MDITKANMSKIAILLSSNIMIVLCGYLAIASYDKIVRGIAVFFAYFIGLWCYEQYAHADKIKAWRR